MALQPMKPSSGGGFMNSKVGKVGMGFAEGGPLGAAMALSDNPNLAMVRKLAGAASGSPMSEEVQVDPDGLGSQFAPTQQYGLGVDTSMPGAQAAPQGAIGRRLSILGGSR